MSDREGKDPLLDHLRQLVRHHRAPALPGTQDLQPVALDLALPGVVRRTVNTEDTTRGRDIGAGGLGEKLLAIAEQHVILSHATPS
jgi:hypothetical protein